MFYIMLAESAFFIFISSPWCQVTIPRVTMPDNLQSVNALVAFIRSLFNLPYVSAYV